MVVDNVQTCLQCEYTISRVNIDADICFVPNISTFYCDVIDDVIVVKMTYIYVFWAKEPDSEIRMQMSIKLTKIEK